MRPGLWQIVLVIVLIFILFGSSKIPDMMRNLANGINVFKKEMKDTETEVEKKPDVQKSAAVKKSAPKKVTSKKPVPKKATLKKAPAKKSVKK